MASHENRLISFVHRGGSQAMALGVLGAFFGVLLRVAGMVRGPIWLAALGGGTIGFLIGRGITRAFFGGGEELVKQIVMPDAKGTYAPQYSHIQALEVQEKHAEAFEAWMQLAAEQPGNPSPLLRAADLKLRQLKEPAAALALFEQVRAMPGIREEHVRYASQKIIDVHLEPGGDEGRALVELRRFIHSFPEGREADGARAAIARIKGRQAQGEV
jgi:hypothetical protein